MVRDMNVNQHKERNPLTLYTTYIESYVENDGVNAVLDDSSKKPVAHQIPPCFLSTRAYIESLPPGAIPDRCPLCGSKQIAPLFWPDPSLDRYSCFNDECLAEFGWRS